MKLKYLILLSIPVIMQACSGGEEKKEDKSADNEAKDNARYDLALGEQPQQFFKALPAPELSQDDPKVKLGHKLFFDKQLSKDGNISCNSCHNLATFGVDNLSFSPGDDGTLGGRNSPTALNAFLHISQFWDGRAKDVEEQAGMPILNPVEMAIPDKAFLVKRLSASEEYQNLFKTAFPDVKEALTYDNIQNAIGAFERTLVTPSRFDSYMNGDKNALTVAEKKGMLSFINTGCVQCHTGANIGGNMMQKFGIYGNYWEHTKSAKVDEGRFEVTKNELDKYMFKVPTLRNVEKTAPYFHDGSIADLNEAVRIMGKVQLNKDLSDDEINNIVTFLKALTGEVPQYAQQAPTM